jgi:transcription antitermination factor NusA-like protein
MVNTIDMKDMRQLKLFSKVTRISTNYIFNYNEQVIFCVPKPQLQRAIGPGASNIRRLSEILKKRVKILPHPRGTEDAKTFIEKIVAPVTFKDLDITDKEIILTAGPQSKAALLGRNKRRLLEMQEIVDGFFRRGYRVV